MRKSLILGSVVAAALTVGGLSGIAQAGSGSGNGPDAAPDPAAVPTTVPGELSLDQILSILTPEQFACVLQSLGAVDPNSLDMNSALAVLQQCGISLDQLTAGLPATTLAAVPGPTTGPGPDLGALDPATVSAIFTMLGLDATNLACIRAAVGPGVVSDDVGAVSILQSCGLTLVGLLNGLALFGAGGGTPVATTAPPAPPVPPVPGGTTASGAVPDAMIQPVIDMLASVGLTVSPEQASCVLMQASSGLDTSDEATFIAVLESCGIDTSVLFGS